MVFFGIVQKAEASGFRGMGVIEQIKRLQDEYTDKVEIHKDADSSNVSLALDGGMPGRGVT